MRRGLSDTAWASAVQWARVGIGGVVFLIAARSLPVEEIGAFATAAAPLRFLQVIHKGGVEDAAVTTPPDDSAALAALHRLSLWAGVAAAAAALALAPLLDHISPGARIGSLVVALSATSLAHGVSAVPDGILRRAGRFRALAMRTLAGQLTAAALGLATLAMGAGIWALVVFTLAQAGIAAAIALGLTGWPRGPAAPFSQALARVAPLAGRVLSGAMVQPLLQIAIGATAGLAAAGIWQIATRVLALLEAVTLVPLRVVALPRLAADGAQLPALLTAAGLAGVWVMGGTALAAPALVAALLGPDGAAVILPLRLLCLSAITGAGTAMLNQAMIGAGRGPLVLRIALASALAAALAGLLALALVPASQAATALAVAQVATGAVPFALLLRASDDPRSALVACLRPWLALAPMALAVSAAGTVVAPPAATFALQAIAGTATLALCLPLAAPRLWRR